MSCNSLGVPAAEAARMLGISTSHFFLLKRSGRIGPKPVRLGRSVLYHCEELEQWFVAGTPPRDKWEALKQRKSIEKEHSR
jgi:predicted DNA-binding transcriptional regulator AlpA